MSNPNVQLLSPVNPTLADGFDTENKFQQSGKRRAEENDKILEQLEAENRGEVLEEEIEEVIEAEAKDKPKNKDKVKDIDWEKRYKDLQSHSAKQLSQKDKEIEAAKEQGKSADWVPESPEEMDAFKKEFPKFYNRFKTMIIDEVKEVKQEVETTRNELSQERQKTAYQRAFNMIIKAHPEFSETEYRQEFTEWLKDQESFLQATINSPTYDEEGARAAIRTISIYKSETGAEAAKKAKASSRSKRSAAESVGKPSSAAPATDSKEKIWRESEIRDMTQDQYEKHEDEIIAAQRSGRFEYDLSQK